MYTVLTTCPDHGSRNVGDRLIEMRLKAILLREKGDDDCLTFFREEALAPRLDEINATRAVLMPGFPIRDTPMHPGTYRLVEDLSRIRVPLIPIGANWNTYPGDAVSREATSYSEATRAFLAHVAGQVEQVSCREPFVLDILGRHGVTNTILTGDPAMFCLSKLGAAMRLPARVGKLVFSPPLSPFYADQADQVLTMLAELFPRAQRVCAFHLLDADTSTSGQSENSAAMSPDVAVKNRRIRDRARELGYDVINLAGHVEGLSYYDACDLHVGYECHAHLYFLSVRSPSVLIAEDARGVGFNQLFGVGGFEAFTRASGAGGVSRKTHTSGYCTTREELAAAPARTDVHAAVADFLQRELDTGFTAYAQVGSQLDALYDESMAPFVREMIP